MIYVEMNKAIPIDIDFTGVEIKGQLSRIEEVIDDNEKLYTFQIKGISAKEANIEIIYNEEDFDEFDFLF